MVKKATNKLPMVVGKDGAIVSISACKDKKGLPPLPAAKKPGTLYNTTRVVAKPAFDTVEGCHAAVLTLKYKPIKFKTA